MSDGPGASNTLPTKTLPNWRDEILLDPDLVFLNRGSCIALRPA